MNTVKIILAKHLCPGDIIFCANKTGEDLEFHVTDVMASGETIFVRCWGAEAGSSIAMNNPGTFFFALWAKQEIDVSRTWE